MENVRKFIKDARKELGKVHWPDRAKVMEMTGIVAGCTAIFALYLWLVDVGIASVFRLFYY